MDSHDTVVFLSWLWLQNKERFDFDFVKLVIFKEKII